MPMSMTNIAMSPDPAIPHGIYYWSCPGTAFQANQPDIQDISYNTSSGVLASDTITVVVSHIIGLPNGAIVTGAIVYGNDAGETWQMRRTLLSTSVDSSMASNNINSEDTSITNATIDNSLYCYIFKTSTLDAADIIYGARITYTI